MSGPDPIAPSAAVVRRGIGQRVLAWWPLLSAAAVALVLTLRALVVPAPLERLRVTEALPTEPAGSVVYQGSIFLPRGGPYMFGFQSVGPARLTIGTQVIDGNGSAKQRIVLPPGATAIRFAATPGARMLWSPPGRRGDMEYVPTASLAPLSPNQAHFSGAGAARLDGIFALALLLIIVAAVLVAARARLARLTRAQWLALVAVAAVALTLRLYDLGGAGQTWDEDANWAAGRNYVTNLLDHDFRPASWQWNYEHPPMMKYLMGIGAQFADGYGPARAMAALLVALSCVLLVPLVGRLFRWQVGVVAGLLAALTPTLLAHSKVVGHEAPTLLWWTLGLLLAVTAFDHLPTSDAAAALRVLRRRLVVLGMVLGLAVASRFINVLLGPLLGLVLLLAAPATLRKSVLLWGAALLPVVAFATLVVVWPRLWTGPFSALAESWQKLKKPHSPEPFLGRVTNKPFPTYFLWYLMATMPIGLLLTMLVGIGSRARVWWQRRADSASSTDPVQRRAGLIMLAWFVIPLGVMASPVRQDGVRYVMPCILAMVTLAAVGVTAIGDYFAARWQPITRVLPALLAGYLLFVCVRIHPYYLDYFGEQVGGPSHVAARHWFETAWWGEGVDRAVAYVNAHAAPGARVYRDCIEPVHLAWFRGDLWNAMAPSPDAADWIVVYSPSSRSCAVPKNAQLEFQVDAAGAPLAVVYHIVRP